MHQHSFALPAVCVISHTLLKCTQNATIFFLQQNSLA